MLTSSTPALLGCGVGLGCACTTTVTGGAAAGAWGAGACGPVLATDASIFASNWFTPPFGSFLRMMEKSSRPPAPTASDTMKTMARMRSRRIMPPDDVVPPCTEEVVLLWAELVAAEEASELCVATEDTVASAVAESMMTGLVRVAIVSPVRTLITESDTV